MIQKIKKNIKNFLNYPGVIFIALICRLRSIYFSRFIDGGNGKITVTDPLLRIKIKKYRDAKLIINGNFRITPHIEGSTPVRIILKQESILIIDGDFVIGQGVRIYLKNNAYLYLGGRKNESDSGITSETLIMVEKRIEIGKDFICAWNVFISDSDWHQIRNKAHQANVIIGDHVWIANNCSILKGSHIGNNSVVASHSKIINKEYSDNSILAGTPAKIVDTDISWSRDFISN
jgi:acetyltransferase-like isoleucine patch superfamily enzyme